MEDIITKRTFSFCRISPGSLSELKNDLITALDEGFIDHRILEELNNEIEVNNRLINGYIKYLRKAKHGDMVNDHEIAYEPNPDNR